MSQYLVQTPDGAREFLMLHGSDKNQLTGTAAVTDYDIDDLPKPGSPSNDTPSTPQQEAVERVQQYKANTAKDVVDALGNDFGSMKSQGLAKALAGAQESIIQKRMDKGEMFGGRMVEVEKPKEDDESGK